MLPYSVSLIALSRLGHLNHDALDCKKDKRMLTMLTGFVDHNSHTDLRNVSDYRAGSKQAPTTPTAPLTGLARKPGDKGWGGAVGLDPGATSPAPSMASTGIPEARALPVPGQPAAEETGNGDGDASKTAGKGSAEPPSSGGGGDAAAAAPGTRSWRTAQPQNKTTRTRISTTRPPRTPRLPRRSHRRTSRVTTWSSGPATGRLV